MPDFKKRSVLTGITVLEAMQRNVCRLETSVSLKACIHHMTRCRENAVLLKDPGETEAGIISKTDITGACYAGMPVETPARDLMNPAVFCAPGDRLEQVLSLMEEQAIHRVYVRSETSAILGTLSFSGIVGLLYRYCRSCVKSRRQAGKIKEDGLPRIRIREVMTDHVYSCLDGDSIGDAIELLLCSGTGAVLVVDDSAAPVGVVSKTDVNRAFFHGRPAGDPLDTVMTRPVVSCHADEYLVDGLQKMFLFDLHRLFVLDQDSGAVRGVLSLSDAARFRSGTCQACSASRILP